MNTIPTSKGDLTPEQILDHLIYSSYKVQRQSGCTHEQLMRIGLGKQEYNERYNKERNETTRRA